ncbi:hypothetical protein ACOI22_03445 [Glaciecola sp. 2405UD65-10]|uniref:hypothetical protein n=1 Tax=Glaciecola sp. 2405UD65-10 TaxID=3397244 RepID=UPI003B5AA39D
MINWNDLSPAQKQAHEIDQLNWDNEQLMRVRTRMRIVFYEGIYIRFSYYTVETRKITREFKANKIKALMDNAVKYIGVLSDPFGIYLNLLKVENELIIDSRRNDNQPKTNQYIVKVNDNA